MKELKPHPSGRPERPRIVKSDGFWRRPPEGPITPRLQIPERAFEVGFHRAFRDIPGLDDEE